MDVIEIRKVLEERKGEKAEKSRHPIGNGQCKNCAPIIPVESPKTVKEEESDGGYYGRGSKCEGKKSCMVCGEKPQFVGIDYSRD